MGKWYNKSMKNANRTIKPKRADELKRLLGELERVYDEYLEKMKKIEEKKKKLMLLIIRDQK